MLSLRTSRLGAWSCLVALLPLVACSSTVVSPNKGSTAGSAGTSDEGGSGGEDNATGGKSSKGGTSAKGGTSTKSSTARGGSSSTEGGTSAAATGGTTSAAVGGTSATTGGTSALGGTSATVGGSSATTGGTPAVGGTSATTGGASAVGGTSSVGGTSTVGGTSAAGGSTAAVSTKPWLAYVAGSVPYLVDITKATPTPTNLATLLGQTCSGPTVRFSPNGTKLMVQCTTALLYVIDVSGSSPGAPLKVSGNRTVADNSGWSPDSRWIGFFDNTVTSTAGTTNVYVVDTNGNTAPTPIILAQSVGIDPISHGGKWAGSSYFVWEVSAYASAAAHYNGSGWLSAVFGPSFPGGGFGSGMNAPGKIVGTASHSTYVSFAHDFATDTTSYDLPEHCSYSPDLTLAICPTSNNKVLYKPFVSSSTTYATLSSTSTAQWANLTNFAAITPTASVNARLVDGTGTTPVNKEIPSSIGYSGFVFAPDDSRLALYSTTQIATLPIASTLSSPTVVSTALPSGGTLSSGIGFAPTAKSMYYIGQQSTAGVSELYWVDLAGSAPAAPRKLNAPLASGINVTRAGFTADSVYAYYVAGTALYLTDLRSPAASAVPLLSSYTSFDFQR